MNPSTFDPFADMNRVNIERCKNGYTIEDLSATAHAVFTSIVGDNNFISNNPWTLLSYAHREFWLPVARMAICLFDSAKDEAAEVSVSVSKTAINFYKQFTAMVNAEDFADLPLTHRQAWQAIVRHLANIIDSDGDLDFAELEERIITWARERIAGPQLVLS